MNGNYSTSQVVLEKGRPSPGRPTIRLFKIEEEWDRNYFYSTFLIS